MQPETTYLAVTNTRTKSSHYLSLLYSPFLRLSLFVPPPPRLLLVRHPAFRLALWVLTGTAPQEQSSYNRDKREHNINVQGHIRAVHTRP